MVEKQREPLRALMARVRDCCMAKAGARGGEKNGREKQGGVDEEKKKRGRGRF